ncbi:PhzF family phenazine biosynthesis protein [Piscinibacter sakaiensis]|uniref:PhzF family phenazine biosynthesis protein n=1 Tax=Piscinibacter sakaiensis TaxID=1547922 RepID=UPI003AB03373
MPNRRFHQVDVFSDRPLYGNPLAVVVDGDGLDDAAMARLARWTNLSETTFLLPPTETGADYRLRIFTPGGELPFAGHPTLGSCHVWLATGGRPAANEIVQQCAVGLVRIRRQGGRLAFAAPPLRRSGDVDPELLARIARGLRIERAAIEASQWIDNGPGWVAVMIDDRERLLALQPDYNELAGIKLGVVARWPDGPAQFEVRAFIGFTPGFEDPVTGSLNAGLAQWLISSGRAPTAYVASQGSALQRAGRVHIEQDGSTIWVGGDVTPVIDGSLAL